MVLRGFLYHRYSIVDDVRENLLWPQCWQGCQKGPGEEWADATLPLFVDNTEHGWVIRMQL